MRSGKVSEAILVRSVLKEIHKKNNNVISGPGIGNDGAVLQLDSPVVTATTTVTLGEGYWGLIGVNRVLNDIAGIGGVPVGISLNITMPEKFNEKVLKDIMRQTERQCIEHGIQIVGGHTEICNSVNKPVVSYTVIGNRKYNITGTIEPGQKIILTKWIGMEGAYLLSQYKRQELRVRFNSRLMDFVEQTRRWISVREEAEIAAKNGAVYMHNLSNGGILNALWELAGKGNVGIRADLKKIPVRQEIIEVSEFFNINPYQLLSGGSLLIMVPADSRLDEILLEEGIPAAVIGEVTDNNDKILINDDEIRYIDASKRDELWKVINPETKK